MKSPEELDSDNVVLKEVSSMTESRQMIDQYVKNFCNSKTVSHPPSYQTTGLIKSDGEKSNVEYLQDFIKKSSISEALKNRKFPEKLIDIMKKMQIVKDTFAHDISYSFTEQTMDTYKIHNYIGAASQFQDYVLYGLYHATIQINLQFLYNTVKREYDEKYSCGLFGLFTCTRHKVAYDKVKRPPNTSEKLIIEKELEARSLDAIKKKINSFK